jgi:prepilin-type N-terminal cleavage/methylation domain-containing protein
MMSKSRLAGNHLRSAFTLIELIVTITIIAVIAGLTALFFPRFQEKSQAESGADSVSGWLLIAKQQARRDQRPTGLRLIAPSSGTYYSQLQYIQQPNDYTTGTYTGQGASNTIATFSGAGSFAGTMPDGSSVSVQAGDYLYLLNAGDGGVLRRISVTPKAGDTTLQLDPNTTPLPAGASPSVSFSYGIILAPRPLSDQTLTLPGSVVIDLSSNPFPPPSGPATLSNPPTRGGNYEILFAPSGAVVGQGTSGAGQIYLWVRALTYDKATGNPIALSAGTGPLLGSPNLICVQPRTGFIASHPVAPLGATNTDPYLFTRDGRSSGM